MENINIAVEKFVTDDKYLINIKATMFCGIIDNRPFPFVHSDLKKAIKYLSTLEGVIQEKDDNGNTNYYIPKDLLPSFLKSYNPKTKYYSECWWKSFNSIKNYAVAHIYLNSIK